MPGRVFLGWTNTKPCSKSQRSAAGEAQTRKPSISSQALYHWAASLPILPILLATFMNIPCAKVVFY